MPTSPNTNNDRTSGGNNIKQNFTATDFGNDHGYISFGHIHKRGDVTADVMLQASDGEHWFAMDKDGQRKGWTTSACPGNFQIECGSANTEEQDTFMINAKNGNIDIIATNGKIRMQANSIELVAVGDNSEGNIVLEATETISLDSSKIIMNSKIKTKIVSSGVTEICSNSCLKLYSSIIRGVTDAVAIKDSKVGGQRFQQECNQA